MVAAVRLTLEDRIQVPVTAFEHAGFRAWVRSDDCPPDIRATFVSGEVLIEMSPESIESHNKAKLEVTAVLAQLIRDGDLGEAFADRALLTLPATATTTEPDFTFVTWATLESNRVRLVERAGREDEYIEIEGAPDLVVEIVSDSSVRKDLGLLRDSYAREGVSEYWVVDARGDAIRFEILVLVGGAYASEQPADAPQRSRVLGRTFTLSRARNRAGRWTYRLSSRA